MVLFKRNSGLTHSAVIWRIDPTTGIIMVIWQELNGQQMGKELEPNDILKVLVRTENCLRIKQFFRNICFLLILAMLAMFVNGVKHNFITSYQVKTVFKVEDLVLTAIIVEFKFKKIIENLILFRNKKNVVK